MPVEIILKTQVEGLGAEADLVRVKPGYARNYLIPRDMAVPATAASKQQLEKLKRLRAEREANELNAAQELAGKLGKLKLTFTLAAVEGQEKVFGSITAQDIADKVKEAGYEIDKRKIDLPKGIKESGSHEVVLHLSYGVNAKLKIEVTHPAKPKTDEESEGKPAKGAKSGAGKKTTSKEKDAKETKEPKAKKSKSSKQEEE